MITMVDELRKYSQLRAPGSMLNVSTFDLGEVVRNTVDLFGQHAAKAGVALSGDSEETEVTGDQQLLREVATNLVSNALQYTPAGGSVEVALCHEGDTAVLTVADTGIGISETDRDKLFDEFHRSKEAKEMFPQGTGLGLTICKQIVLMHAGEIGASARGGGGTVFTIRIPLQPPGAGAGQADAARQRPY